MWLKIDKGDCIRMDYLVQKPELTQRFCDHRDWFVLEDLKCEPRPSPAATAAPTPASKPTAPQKTSP